MEKKLPGRPTVAIKDRLLKLRVESNTLHAIDNIAKETNRNRSDLVREVLPQISSRDFESMISLSTLQRLEEYSIKCRAFFQNSEFKIKLDEISDKFPAFVVEEIPSPILYIKNPTYKIRILSTDDCKKIKTLVSDVAGISNVYLTPSLLLTSYEMKETYFPEIMCLKNSLLENIMLRDQLCNIFENSSVKYQVLPSYNIIGKEVNIIVKDDVRFVVNK